MSSSMILKYSWNKLYPWTPSDVEQNKFIPPDSIQCYVRKWAILPWRNGHGAKDICWGPRVQDEERQVDHHGCVYVKTWCVLICFDGDTATKTCPKIYKLFYYYFTLPFPEIVFPSPAGRGSTTWQTLIRLLVGAPKIINFFKGTRQRHEAEARGRGTRQRHEAEARSLV